MIKREAGNNDMFLVQFRGEGATHPASEWVGSKKDALFRFRTLIREGEKDVRVLRYSAPPFPSTATARQVALYALKTLGCSAKGEYFVRTEAYDPGL